jgi:hypothetical protein
VLVPVRTQPVRLFANRSTPIDNSSDDELATIASLKNEFVYKHFIEDYSNLDWNDDSDLMVAVSSIVHEKIS